MKIDLGDAAQTIATIGVIGGLALPARSEVSVTVPRGLFAFVTL